MHTHTLNKRAISCKFNEQELIGGYSIHDFTNVKVGHLFSFFSALLSSLDAAVNSYRHVSVLRSYHRVSPVFWVPHPKTVRGHALSAAGLSCVRDKPGGYGESGQ